MTGVGNAANNTLIGNGLANHLAGGLGNDVLDGRAGADLMNGGAGNDSYVVDSLGDRIVDSAGIDTVRTTINGYRLAAGLENLILLGAAPLSGLGNAVANTLVGNAGANVLQGLAGDDVLSGGAGADQMLGGAGNDRYYVDNAADRVIEGVGQGIDTAFSSVTYALAANVENGTLTGAAAIGLYGNVAVNVLVGNAGANTLNGGLGADVMAGGAGNDTYVVDAVADRVVEGAGAGIDRVIAQVGITLAANVENVTLAGSVTAAIGNGAGNLMYGNAAANVLHGLGGNDTLSGGAGADRMVGGLGNDSYYVDHAGDLVSEAAGQGTDTVYANRSYALGANVENGTLIGSAALGLAGNGLSNVLSGNAAGNVLIGGRRQRLALRRSRRQRRPPSAARPRRPRPGGRGPTASPSSPPANSPVGAGRDIIQDFARGVDRIDLSPIDADLTRPGNHAFSYEYYWFSGTAGEVRFANGMVEGDRNGDGYADLQIAVAGTNYLYGSDFVL